MTITSVFYCGIFHLQNTFQCSCIRYHLVMFTVFFSLMFWVSHFINQDNVTAFCIIRKYLLFCKTFKPAPAKRAHWSTYQLLSQCCPLLPRYPPHWSCTDINFFCVHLHEWTWDCYGSLVMKYGGSACYWMQYSDINCILNPFQVSTTVNCGHSFLSHLTIVHLQLNVICRTETEMFTPSQYFVITDCNLNNYRNMLQRFQVFLY